MSGGTTQSISAKSICSVKLSRHIFFLVSIVWKYVKYNIVQKCTKLILRKTLQKSTSSLRKWLGTSWFERRFSTGVLLCKIMRASSLSFLRSQEKSTPHFVRSYFSLETSSCWKWMPSLLTVAVAHCYWMPLLSFIYCPQLQVTDSYSESVTQLRQYFIVSGNITLLLLL